MPLDCPGHADFGKSSYDLFTDKNGEFRRMIAELNSVKPFNQFASEMDKLKKQRIALGDKISTFASKHRPKI